MVLSLSELLIPGTQTYYVLTVRFKMFVLTSLIHVMSVQFVAESRIIKDIVNK